MELTTYQSKVVSLLKPEIANGNFMEKTGYLIAKMSSEVGEVFGEFCKRKFHNKLVTPEKFKDELGDIAWYLFNLIDILPEDYHPVIYEIFDVQRGGMTADDAVFVTLMTLMRNCGQACDYWTIGSFAENNVKCHSVLSSVLCGIVHIYLTLIDELGFELKDVLQSNIDKLSERHGDVYSPKFYTKPLEPSQKVLSETATKGG